MALISESRRRVGYPIRSAVPAAPASGAEPRHDSAPSRVRRFVPHLAVHNVWMVVLLIVMVGKVGEWVPLISGLPVLKIAFIIAALYVNRVGILYAPVRVLSLPIARPALGFLILSILSVAFSVYKSATLAATYLAAIYIVSFVMLVKTTQNLRDIERLLIGLAVAGSSLAIALLVDFHGGRGTINRNFDPNDLAYSLDTLLPIVLALRGSVWGLRRVLVTALVLVMVMAVLLTASRGGLLGLIAVMVAESAFPLGLTRDGHLMKFRGARLVWRLGLVALVGAFFLTLLPTASKDRLASLLHPSEDYNTSTTLNTSRLVIWRRDTLLALERPIGYGMGTSTAVDGIYGHGLYRAVHNSVIQALVEIGLVGLCLYLASYYAAWRELGRITSRYARAGPDGEDAKAALYARALGQALIGSFVAGFFLSQAYSASLWMILAICCAFVRVVGASDSAPMSQPAAATPRWRRRRPLR